MPVLVAMLMNGIRTCSVNGCTEIITTQTLLNIRTSIYESTLVWRSSIRLLIQLLILILGDHCIEYLRSSALCHADTSLTTFQWETAAEPVLDLYRPIHACVNWPQFEASFRHRVVDEQELARLKNPDLRSEGA
ncbi:hypothetical protein EV356DRAFT_501411 [Viridothelium virens]|uniref:Uncharacterized protein n=1 Tax=Viridothelium virens TaxID=1048519 RepID=A0A6A6H9S0_VIRVR|nr:hypothetical protein EV356DRAFT_501411 [Viridothelium virens]